MVVLDRIAQGYLGELGEKVQNDSQKRMSWICDCVHGKKVLDIGCSQGICELLLARKGYHVVGIDIAQESIEYAKNLIKNEPEEVTSRIEFLCDDYLAMPYFPEKFDTILLTEVLEHLEFPEAMVQKAIKDLSDDGELIVTVPFGINDFPDHKHTFYMVEILRMLAPHVQVETVEFMGGWIGFYTKKVKDPDPFEQIDRFLLKREEQAFFAIERPLRDRITKLDEFGKNVNQKYKTAEQNYQKVKGWFEKKKEQVEQQQETIKALEQRCLRMPEMEKQLKESNEKIIEQEQLLKQSYDELGTQEQLLEGVKRQLQQMNTKLQLLNIKNKEYEVKLNKIYGTWYGCIALKVYKALKKVKRMLHK